MVKSERTAKKSQVKSKKKARLKAKKQLNEYVFYSPEATYTIFKPIFDAYTCFMDVFFCHVCYFHPEVVENLLRLLLQKPDLKVINFKTQQEIISLAKRSVRLDVLADDSEGKKYNIEIQQISKRAMPKRARFYASVIDSNQLKKRETFDQLPESYVIFICKDDPFGYGLPFYTIKRTIAELDHQDFGDAQYIIYVNGAWRGKDALGDLMFDFDCPNPEAIRTNWLQDAVKDVKTIKGELYMFSPVMKKHYHEYTASVAEKSREKGREEGRKEGLAEGLAKGLAKGRKEGLAEGLAKSTLDFATQLILDNVDFATIRKYTKLSYKKLEALALELKG